MDHNQEQRRRGHFHRGRRGPDRRGLDRRSQQPPPAQPRDQVDVEQIMRDIRARIAQRGGVELTNQQIQELAARRLESILDPRSLNPQLLDELRRATGAAVDTPARAPEPAYTFDDTTLFESHNAVTRFFRKLLRPLLMLFFNPTPLVRALKMQSALNTEAAAREAERERRQAEWNALHYEVVQKLVIEVARVSLDNQALAMKVESLSAKVDFNERRVRGLEGSMHQSRPAPRRELVDAPPPPSIAAAEPGAPEASGASQPVASPVEGTRRRRRRRRGRRSGSAPGDTAAVTAEGTTNEADADLGDGSDVDEPEDDEVSAVGGDEDSPAVADALVASEAPAERPNLTTFTPASPAAPEPAPEPVHQTAHESPAPPPDGPERHRPEPPER